MQLMIDEDLTGSTIGRYVVVAFVRGGAQGRVYRGRDDVLCREVAIKALNPNDQAIERSTPGLIGEARALSSLNHPNVAGVYDFITHNAREFIVMEFIPGATLAELLAGGPLSIPEVLRLGLQLARGVAAIHAANMAHCDIKPSNLKVTASGVLKIVDFGVARRLLPAEPAEDPSERALVGTLPYMAPEVMRGDRPSEQSDIFSTGAVLYEMATGRRAFPKLSFAGSRPAADGELVPPARINPLVPSALERVVLRALQKAPERRYRTAAELVEACEALDSSRRARGARITDVRSALVRRLRREVSTTVVMKSRMATGSVGGR